MAKYRVEELERLPDVKPLFWSQIELEIAWKYRNKDLKEVAKILERPHSSVKAQVRKMRRERGEL